MLYFYTGCVLAYIFPTRDPYRKTVILVYHCQKLSEDAHSGLKLNINIYFDLILLAGVVW